MFTFIKQFLRNSSTQMVQDAFKRIVLYINLNEHNSEITCPTSKFNKLNSFLSKNNFFLTKNDRTSSVFKKHRENNRDHGSRTEQTAARQNTTHVQCTQFATGVPGSHLFFRSPHARRGYCEVKHTYAGNYIISCNEFLFSPAFWISCRPRSRSK